MIHVTDKTWRSVNTAGVEIPEIHCVKTFVNKNWFDVVKHTDDIIPLTEQENNDIQIAIHHQNISQLLT